MTANQIAYQRVREEQRANLAREAETYRANIASEGLRRAELEELQRHNVVAETETNRSNLARELETSRHNITSERLQSQTNLIQKELGYAKLAEENRHNVTSEIETSAHNENTEYLKSKEIDTSKSNITSKAAADLSVARYKEQQANRRMEQELQTRLVISGFQSGTKVTSDLVKTLVTLYSAPSKGGMIK